MCFWNILEANSKTGMGIITISVSLASMMNIVASTTRRVRMSPIAFKSPFENTLAIPSISLTNLVTSFPTGVLSKNLNRKETMCLKSFERRSRDTLWATQLAK